MKQVSPQISLKSNLIERVVLLRNREGVERLEMFPVGGYRTNSAKHSQERTCMRKQEDLGYITN